MLGEVANSNIVTQDSLALLNGQDASEELEQCGFAGAVRADEDRALTTLSLKVQASIDGEIS